MKILVILITYNSQKWIRKNLRSIFADSDTVSLDVYIVDNGSTDDTVNIIKKEFPRVLLQESKENLGFGKANNLAFSYALKNQYDYVFLVNHDGWLLPKFWENASLILSNPQYVNYGLLSPVHYDETERELDFGFKRYIGNQLKNSEDREVIDVDLINGAFLFISRECLIEAKGFDPIFFFYGEDIDLCLRAKRKGYKIGVMKNAYVVHDRRMRALTEDRIWKHLVANYLIQIKSIPGGFYPSFFKTFYSIFGGYLQYSNDKKTRKNYHKLIQYLWSIKKELKKSYKNFN